MSIAEKLVTIAENEQKVYDKGFADGKAKAAVEIEMTSAVTNAQELTNILFENIPTSHNRAAALTKPKSDVLVNNQYIILYTSPLYEGTGLRLRDGVFANVATYSNYDASVTIGDIYTVYDFGEVQYGY